MARIGDNGTFKWRCCFRFQDVLEIVQAGFLELEDNPTNAQKAAYKDDVKCDSKALFLILHSVDASIIL